MVLQRNLYSVVCTNNLTMMQKQVEVRGGKVKVGDVLMQQRKCPVKKERKELFLIFSLLPFRTYKSGWLIYFVHNEHGEPY